MTDWLGRLNPNIPVLEIRAGFFLSFAPRPSLKDRIFCVRCVDAFHRRVLLRRRPLTAKVPQSVRARNNGATHFALSSRAFAGQKLLPWRHEVRIRHTDRFLHYTSPFLNSSSGYLVPRHSTPPFHKVRNVE